MRQNQNSVTKAIQTLGELLEQVLAIRNSLGEASGSGVEDIKLDKPYPALLSINISSECEETVQAFTFTVGSSHNPIDYIDEVSVYLDALCLRPPDTT